MTSNPPASPAPDTQVHEVVAAGGGHVPALLAEIEVALAEVAVRQGPLLGAHAAATISAGGKRLRPLLVLLSAGPPAESARAELVRAGAAVELLHAATLVHDDVLDDAALRRGEPTVYATAGRQVAIETGDALFAAAFTLLAVNESREQVAALAEAGDALASGELLQRADAWDGAITLERYLLRSELKTARLFEAACVLGSQIRGGEDSVPLRAFARSIGLAFQMLDDVLDVEGPAARTGKHRGTDLLDGTVTLPLILALERDPRYSSDELRAITTPAESEEVCDWIIGTGACDRARQLALDHVARAKQAIPTGDQLRAAALEVVADSVVARYA